MIFCVQIEDIVRVKFNYIGFYFKNVKFVVRQTEKKCEIYFETKGSIKLVIMENHSPTSNIILE